MMKRTLFLSLAVFTALFSASAETIDELLPVRGLAIEAPKPDGMNDFLKFIEGDLVPAHFNLLILRVDWNFAYETHPELRDENPLTKEDVKRIVNVCRFRGIRLVPQINLLGHQSWAKQTHALLREYPQFDETPSVKTENYTEWPNPDGLYCKSYCPLHPQVHDVVFDVVDELCDVFETDAFHAGMDEVFYIGMDECPRCKGRDKAELFAGEVELIRNHLAGKGRQLMIWGDPGGPDGCLFRHQGALRRILRLSGTDCLRTADPRHGPLSQTVRPRDCSAPAGVHPHRLVRRRSVHPPLQCREECRGAKRTVH